MAVEKAKVIARLKVLFPNVNLSQKRLDALADKLCKKPADDAEDSAIDAVINDFNDVYSIAEIAADDDRARTLESEKNRALELAKKKAKSPEEKEEEEEEEDPNLSQTDKLLKGLVKTIGSLKTDLETIKSGKVLETKKQTAQEVFESSEVFKNAPKEIKDFMFKNIDLESETPFEDQVKGLETTFGTMIQNTADNSNFPGAAGTGKAITEVDQKQVDSVLDNMGI